MDRNGNNHHAVEQENGHLSEDDLLLFADGELGREQAGQIQTHLTACWSCRARAEKYEETIRSYVEYRETVQKPADEAPPESWRKFDRQLKDLVVQKGHPSTVSRLRGWFGSLRPDFSFSPQLAGRAAAILAIGGVVLALLLFRSNQITIVSAGELIQRAVDSRAAKIRATSQPVIHQRLQLHRRTQTDNRSISWEVWKDMTSGKFRQFESHRRDAENAETAPRGLNSAPPQRRERLCGELPCESIVIELANVLHVNRMDPQQPLSAAAYKSWRESLAHKEEEVTKTKLPNGTDALILRTRATDEVTEGQITQATFTVRASDWHPVEQQITVKTKGEPVVFELVEMNSEVISLAQVDPKIFSSAPAALTSSASSAPNTSPDSSTNASPFALGPLPAAASADLEVEVLRLIHQTGADMGEQIDVKRAPDGSLKVSGIVETDQRKGEILAGLKSVAGNPAVRIEIQTVAEAVAQHKDSKRNVITEGVEIQRLGIAAEPQLRAYFERRGGNVDAAVRQFAAGAVSQSGRAMQHLGALRRLVNQFSTAQLRDLTPEARANWLGLLRTHARAYQQQTAALRRDLKPIFFAGAGDELPGSPAIRNDEELKRVALDLFATAAANDQVVRSAFTVNSEGARFTAVSTPQFWQAMKKAEALAAAIGRQ